MTRRLSSSSAGVVVGKGLAASGLRAGQGPAFVWTNLQGNAVASGTILSKPTGSPAWDSGAQATVELRAANGYAEFAVTDDMDLSMSGLSTMPISGLPAGQLYKIPWGLYVDGAIGLLVYESGSQVASSAPAMAGEHLRVSVRGGAVVYSRNMGGPTWTDIYTSLVAPSFPLFALGAVYSVGASIGGAALVGPWS